MLPEVVASLACPTCGDELHLDGRTLRCVDGHAFDLARQGYVNLAPTTGRATTTGDTAEMVARRLAVLDAGLFDPLLEQLRSLADQLLGATPDGAIVDVGAGPGVHLAALLDAHPTRVGLALDASRYAARRAARAHPRLGAVVCDVWHGLPVRTGAAALVLDVFAPRNGPEFRRLLAPGGHVVVVTPTASHLQELIDALDLLTVAPTKQAELALTLAPELVVVDEQPLAFPMSLDHAAVVALVGSGPNAHHLDDHVLRQRVGDLPAEVAVTASMVSTVLTTAGPEAGSR